jgi:predicted XRE-type DNA-binding protein
MTADSPVKLLLWLGDSRRRLRDFPQLARQRAGFELFEVQQGQEPSDWKSMRTVGDGVKETMKKRLKVERGSNNVFEDLGFSSEEAENLQLRAQLMSKIRAVARGMTQAEAAKRFGVTQPRLNDVLRGKIDKFSLDALVNMLASAGMRVELRVKKAA